MSCSLFKTKKEIEYIYVLHCPIEPIEIPETPTLKGNTNESLINLILEQDYTLKTLIKVVEANNKIVEIHNSSK